LVQRVFVEFQSGSELRAKSLNAFTAVAADVLQVINVIGLALVKQQKILIVSIVTISLNILYLVTQKFQEKLFFV
jgi:uncharacterized membrane-anchored protein